MEILLFGTAIYAIALVNISRRRRKLEYKLIEEYSLRLNRKMFRGLGFIDFLMIETIPKKRFEINVYAEILLDYLLDKRNFQDYKERWGKKTFTSDEEDDLRQEIIIKFFNVLRKSPKFTYAQARIYLLRIFQTKCIDAIRSKNRQFLRIEDQTSAEFTIIPFEEDSSLTPIEIMQLVEPYWQKALEQSPNSTRMIINLLYEKAPYEQISQWLGEPKYSKSAFKQKVYRAKKTFRNILLKILGEAISRENLNSFEREVIKSLCEKIEENSP